MSDAFDLYVLDTGANDHVVALAKSKFDLAIEPLRIEGITQLSEFREQLATAAAGNGNRPTAEELAEFGRRLYGLLIRNGIERIYNRLPNSHIRLQILSSNANLQALPWEYIQRPGSVPGPDRLRSVVRIVPTIEVEVPEPVALRDGVGILMLYSDPIDQASVEWEDVQATVEREFRAKLPERCRIKVVEGVSRVSLLDALDGDAYQVVHFVGHGEVDDAGVGHLLLQHPKTRVSQRLSAPDLASAVRGKDIRLVVLSACSTSAGDFAKEFAVIAESLVASGVPVVVANQFPLTNSVAATFARGFYNELLRTGDVDLAAASGRVRLLIEPNVVSGSRFEWGIPTLYRHFAASRLFVQETQA